jgi:pyrimidine deaminase RibD-like protein
MSKANIEFMREAIRLSIDSVKKGGGPFGAVVVKDGQVVAGSANSVTMDNDPTAHAEVNAIRKAAKVLGTFDLSGCEFIPHVNHARCVLEQFIGHISTLSIMVIQKKMQETLASMTLSYMKNLILLKKNAE